MLLNFLPKKIIFFVFVVAGLLAVSGQAMAEDASTQCKPATLNLVFRDSNNNYLPGITVDVYEQKVDADGKPAPGKKLISAKTLPETGIAEVSIKPDPQLAKGIAFKAYDKNHDVGAFWFFDGLSISCGQISTITKKLSSITFVFRNDAGELKKNIKFSLYTQRYDVDHNPINEKEDLVYGNFDTAAAGRVTAYVPDKTRTLKRTGGDYILAANLGGVIGEIETSIRVFAGTDTVFEYVYSDMAITLEDAEGNLLPADRSIELFEQENNVKGDRILGKSIKNLSNNSKGQMVFEYPAGTYAAVLKDDFNQKDIFWNLVIEKGKRTELKLTAGLARFIVAGGAEKAGSANKRVLVYSLTQDDKGNYYRDKQLGNLEVSAKGYAEAHLAPGKYLVAYTAGSNKEYGQLVNIRQGQLQKITLSNAEVGKSVSASVASGVKAKPVVSNLSKLAGKLKGYILLQVESLGEAWYVDPKTAVRHYLKNGEAALVIMRKSGVGISDLNLDKLPIGLVADPKALDSDSDGLPDKLEEALGTDSNDKDSDDDGYVDGAEVRSGYDPLGAGKAAVDRKFADKQKGKILIQVESRGEAWYVNPKDGKRYYLPNGASAYSLMRNLGMGITDDNLSIIQEAD